MKILIDSNNVVLSWQTIGGGWSDTENTTVDVAEIPNEVKATPSAFCYIADEVELDEQTEVETVEEFPSPYVSGQFVANPNYVEPNETEEPSVEKQLEDMQLALCEVYEMLLG